MKGGQCHVLEEAGKWILPVRQWLCAGRVTLEEGTQLGRLMSSIHFKFEPRWPLWAKYKEYLGSHLQVGSDRDSRSVKWGQGKEERDLGKMVCGLQGWQPQEEHQVGVQKGKENKAWRRLVLH